MKMYLKQLIDGLKPEDSLVLNFMPLKKAMVNQLLMNLLQKLLLLLKNYVILFLKWELL